MAWTLNEIAAALGGEVIGDGAIRVTGAAEPGAAGPDEIAVAMSPKYAEALGRGRARSAILWTGADPDALGLEAAVTVGRARYAMAHLTRLVDPGTEFAPGRHATAVIDPSAEVADDARIGPFAVIGPRARIGPGARIASHVSIGEDAVIGEAALLHAGVRIAARVRIGDRLIAQPNAVIGGDGFSFVTPEKSTMETARESLGSAVEARAQSWVRIHSAGAVTIGDDVEIGANSAIDRGTIRDTEIGDGTKIDNLVQVGHNVRVGRDCLLCGMVAVGGSTEIGDRVVIGGAAGLADNLRIGDDAVIAGKSGVASNVPAGRAVMGYPAVKMDLNVAIYRALRRLPQMLEDVRALKKAVSKPDGSD